MFFNKGRHIKEHMSTLENQIAKLRHQRLNTEGEELGQSISNNAALITEQATADVYTPNNISQSSKQAANSARAIAKGADEQLARTGIMKYAKRTLPHMFTEKCT